MRRVSSRTRCRSTSSTERLPRTYEEKRHKTKGAPRSSGPRRPFVAPDRRLVVDRNQDGVVPGTPRLPGRARDALGLLDCVAVLGDGRGGVVLLLHGILLQVMV